MNEIVVVDDDAADDRGVCGDIDEDNVGLHDEHNDEMMATASTMTMKMMMAMILLQ